MLATFTYDFYTSGMKKPTELYFHEQFPKWIKSDEQTSWIARDHERKRTK